MSNAITYNRWDAGQPAYDRWMGGNAWEEEGTITEEEMNSVDNMPSGEILNESLPHYKWEYDFKKNKNGKCIYSRRRHYYHIPLDKLKYKEEGWYSIAPLTYTFGTKWEYLSEYKTSVKKIESEVIELNQTLEQLGTGTYSMQLPLNYKKGVIEVQYNFC